MDLWTSGSLYRTGQIWERKDRERGESDGVVGGREERKTWGQKGVDREREKGGIHGEREGSGEGGGRMMRKYLTGRKWLYGRPTIPRPHRQSL